MSKLFKLKPWLSLEDASRHLTIALGEEVAVWDVLRFGLDGHLKLSVNFVNSTYARQGHFVSNAEAELMELPDSTIEKPVKVIRGRQVRKNEVLELDRKITLVQGVWDLMMVGAERRDVENLYQELTGGPQVTDTRMEGVFIDNQHGMAAELQEQFEPRSRRSSGGGANRPMPEDFFPTAALPPDTVLVVRTGAIADFLKRLSDGDSQAAPLEERERATLLVVLAALAKEAKIDIQKPSKAAGLIESLTTQLGARVAARTIAGHLKRIPDALERRSATEA